MRHTISHQFSQMSSDMKQWMQLAASVLANQTHAASLVTAPQPTEARIKHLELISTHGRQILAILVMEGGQIHQNILTLEEPASQALSCLLNSASCLRQEPDCHHHTRDRFSIGKFRDGLDAGRNGAFGPAAHCEIFMDGITNILSEPNSLVLKKPGVLLLDERSTLRKCFLEPFFLKRRRRAGSHRRRPWDDLRQCSVILSK
jgi:heat-inducible transcriptional repressor